MLFHIIFQDIWPIQVFPAPIHISYCIFLWEPCFRFLYMVLVPYMIGQRLIVFWRVELYLPLSCSLIPHTSIYTIASFGNSPCSSRPCYRALCQLLARFFWMCSGFLDLFFLWSFFLPTPLALHIPLLVWLLMFYRGVGVWPSCVSSPILLNVALGRLLMGFLLPFYLLGGRSVLWDSLE